jgi:hypothetical protein
MVTYEITLNMEENEHLPLDIRYALEQGGFKMDKIITIKKGTWQNLKKKN